MSKIQEEENRKHPEGRNFPDEGQNEKITCHVLTNDYLIYGTEVSCTICVIMLK